MDKAPCGKENYKYTWSREATKILIELYELHPCLYQVSCKDYYNKVKRTSAFEEITREFNQRNFTNLSLKSIQDKIHGVRTQFMSEVNKMKKSKVSGAGTDEIYKPKLWCYELLQFLLKANVVTQGESNLQNPQDNQEATEGDFVDEPEVIYEGDIEHIGDVMLSPTTSRAAFSDEEDLPSRASSRLSDPPKKKRRISKAEGKMGHIETLMETAANTLKNLSAENQEVSSNAAFSQFITTELNTMKDEEIVDEVKQQIVNILFKGKKVFREKNKM